MANERKRGGGAPPASAAHRAGGTGAPGQKRPSSPLGVKASDEVKQPTGTGHVQPRRAERRPEMIKQQREARLQAYEKRRRQWLITRIALGAFALVVVVGVGALIYGTIQDRRENKVPEGTRNYTYAGGDHVDGDVVYAETPPVGGEHDASWQNCGYYDAPIREENAVHSLEHGAVWITYRPDLAQDQVDSLRDRADQSHVLVSPYPDLPAPVVASSWGHQVQLDGADDERLGQFIRRFRNGPDTPEPGASCSGNVGTPL